MRGISLAVSMFSVLPAPSSTRRGTLDRPATAAVVRWLPALGLLLGGIAGAGGALLSYRLPSASLLCAVVAVTVLAVLTGGLHLDGLADTADGLGSRAEPSRALEIMRRSDIGPFGVMALILVLLLDIAALSTVHGGHWRPAAALAVAAVTGRVAATHAALPGVPAARDSGFGSLVTGSISRSIASVEALLAVAVAALLDALTGASGAEVLGWPIAVGAALVVGWGARRLVTNRLGGVTGDVFGALIEFTTMLTLLGISVSW